MTTSGGELTETQHESRAESGDLKRPESVLGISMPISHRNKTRNRTESYHIALVGTR